jgi:hypothetical protein
VDSAKAFSAATGTSKQLMGTGKIVEDQNRHTTTAIGVCVLGETFLEKTALNSTME